MEKKTIAMLVVSALILILGVVFACGIGRGGELTYQKPGPYTAERSNDYSNVQVAMTIQGDQILDAEITSSGDNDLLTDELRAQWADSIVANQSYENDVISSASLKYSADSVKEAAADIFTQAGLPTPEPAATPEPEPEPEPEAEAPADEAATPADGEFHVEKTTDFSTIDVGITVEDGKITDASVTSAPLEGQVDMLTDDIRSAWAQQIVEKRAVDAVSGVTVSSDAVRESVEQLMVQVNGGGEAAGLADGTYQIQETTDFSTIDVEMTVENGVITAAKVSSEGANDLLTDDHRNTWAAQIVEKQAIDAISGVTVSSNAVQEAIGEILAQASASATEAAPAAALNDGTYSVDKDTGFSTIHVEAIVKDGAISEATITSEGANDLLTDDHRNTWAAQIVEKQAIDAVSGVTVSSNAVQEAIGEILAQASASTAEAVPSASLNDGTYSVDKDTGFSTIHVEMTVEGGNVTAANVTSEGANDLLNDDSRAAFAAQIVEKQAVDAVSGVTVSSNAIQEAVTELLTQAAEGAPEADPSPKRRLPL